MALVEMVPGKLWQSGMFEAAEAEIRVRFDLFINCCHANIPARDGAVLIHFPFADEAKLPDLAGLHEVAGWAASAVKAGSRVLVSCAAGYNRSGLVVGLAILKLGIVPTGRDAVAYVRQRHAGALCNGVFADYLEGL